jgi:hypothetical protein
VATLLPSFTELHQFLSTLLISKSGLEFSTLSDRMFENVFSRRKGYTPPPVQGKLEELSDHTRNRLWDIFYLDIYRANQLDDITGGLVSNCITQSKNVSFAADVLLPWSIRRVPHSDSNLPQKLRLLRSACGRW